MPTLTQTTQALRITQATKALSLMSQGKTQQEACDIAGISPYQFRNWLGTQNEAIEAIRDMAIELERANLATVISARGHILRRLYEIVTTVPLPAKDLVIVDQHLAKVQEGLESKYGTQAQDAQADEYLKLAGPTLIKHESVFAAKVTLESSRSELSTEFIPAGTNSAADVTRDRNEAENPQADYPAEIIEAEFSE